MAPTEAAFLRQREERLVTRIITLLPPEKDVGPLLGLSAQTGQAHAAAMRQIIARKHSVWLIERAATGNANERAFASQIVADHIPVGDIKGDLTSIVGGRSVSRSALLEAVQRRCEEALVGQFAVDGSAVWRVQTLRGSDGSEYRLEAAEDPVAFSTQRSMLAISVSQGTWNIRFLDQQWSGPFDDLGTVRLACPMRSVSSEISDIRHMLDNPSAQLVLTITGKGATIEAAGVPAFEPGYIRSVKFGGDEPSSPSRSPQAGPPEGYFLLGTRATSTERYSARGGRISGSVQGTTYYLKPGAPGFASVTFTLRKM